VSFQHSVQGIENDLERNLQNRSQLLLHQAVFSQKVGDLLVASGSVIMKIKAMGSVRLDDNGERLGRGEGGLRIARNGGACTASVETVTTAERHIIGAGDDEDGASKFAGRRNTADSQELTDGKRLLVLLPVLEKLGIEVTGVQEHVLVVPNVRVGQVARRVILACFLRKHQETGSDGPAGGWHRP
jgi:hypothetical protein